MTGSHGWGNKEAGRSGNQVHGAEYEYSGEYVCPSDYQPRVHSVPGSHDRNTEDRDESGLGRGSAGKELIQDLFKILMN